MSTPYEITWLVRRLFRSLAAAADQYLDQFGISASERAVMEFLYPQRSLTVPGIADRYRVSRQHVQQTTNGLIEKSLLRRLPNPVHKRSPLYSLSIRGRDTFRRVQLHEDEEIDALFGGIPESDLELTRAVLRQLLGNLEGENHEPDPGA